MRTLTASIEEGLAAYVSSASSSTSSSDSQSDQQQHKLLLPSFTGDFTRAEAGKALALHLVAHMQPLEPEVPLIPDRYRCVFVFAVVAVYIG